jgi:hypothetical protein
MVGLWLAVCHKQKFQNLDGVYRGTPGKASQYSEVMITKVLFFRVSHAPELLSDTSKLEICRTFYGTAVLLHNTYMVHVIDRSCIHHHGQE